MDSDAPWGPPSDKPPPPPTPTIPVQDDGVGTTVLVLGILGLVFCQLLSPVAWLMGSEHLRSCEAANLPPSQLAVAGRLLGMIGTMFLGFTLLLVGVYMAIVVLAVVAG
jgi:hypothetical protein